MFTGSVAFPVSADAVILPPAPTFTVATAKAPFPFAPAMFTMPSCVAVDPSATMSGTGDVAADSNRVLSPTSVPVGRVLVPEKLNTTSVGAIGALGCRAMKNVCVAPGKMLTGAFGAPIGWFVTGFVAWYVRAAGIGVT